MKTATLQPEMNQMVVTFEDVSIMQQVKKALTLMRGVKSITMPRKKRMCGLDRALKDVEEGRVTRWNSVEEMFEALNKEDTGSHSDLFNPNNSSSSNYS